MALNLFSPLHAPALHAIHPTVDCSAHSLQTASRVAACSVATCSVGVHMGAAWLVWSDAAAPLPPPPVPWPSLMEAAVEMKPYFD